MARKGQQLVSVPLAEYEAVCSEAEHQLAAGLSENAGIFLDAVLAMAEPVKTHFLWRPQLRDPADEMVLGEAAANGRADEVLGEIPTREISGRYRRNLGLKCCFRVKHLKGYDERQKTKN